MLPLMPLLGVFKFSSMFNFIRQNWQLVSLIIIIGGSYWYVKSLHNEIEDKTNEIAELKIAKAFCENSRASLEAAIKEQNSEIQKWVTVGKKSKKEFEDLKSSIEQQRKVNALELQKILQEKKPESCQEAINYLVDGVKDITWVEK